MLIPFVKKLVKTFDPIPVKRIDERYTSKMAKQAIIAGIKKQARRNKAMVDKISAVIILQSFLDRENYLNDMISTCFCIRFTCP
jgi:putative holliday junction resolvase